MFYKKILKRVIEAVLSILLLDWWIFIFSKILYYLSKLLFLRDWRYNDSDVPKFFKHQIDVNLWRFNPSEWSFTLRGSLARLHIFQGCKVLDLCCGDGSYSYLFFSDVSSSVDAIDYDHSAISYAKRYYKHSKINYQQVNIIDTEFPANDYDVIVWNAGISYFTKEQIKIVLDKIVNSGGEKLILCGMTPKANGHIDHKTEFETVGELRMLLNAYFEEINIQEVIEGNNSNIVTFYFNAQKPKCCI